jgi:hypothetical protein
MVALVVIVGVGQRARTWRKSRRGKHLSSARKRVKVSPPAGVQCRTTAGYFVCM